MYLDDFDAPCRKCGSEQSSMVWTAAGTFDHVTLEVIPEHMARTCLQCGYAWRSCVLDADDELPTTSPQ